MSPKLSFLLCCIVRSIFTTNLFCAINFSNPATCPTHLVRHDLMTLIIFVLSEIINYFVMVCIIALFSRHVSERPVLQNLICVIPIKREIWCQTHPEREEL
jgi:hypothetical protein